MDLEQLAEIELSITDDSGMLALVNSHRYNSFIDGDWSFEQLKQRFFDQIRDRNLFVWPTGGEAFYQVAVLSQLSNKTAFKEFIGEIEVTNRCLHLTNYEDLSMVAQFADEKLPVAHNSNLVIQLPNGIYSILVRQLFRPDAAYDQNDNVAFEIVLLAKGQ